MSYYRILFHKLNMNSLNNNTNCLHSINTLGKQQSIASSPYRCSINMLIHRIFSGELAEETNYKTEITVLAFMLIHNTPKGIINSRGVQ